MVFYLATMQKRRFIFIEYFQLSPSMYGFLGIVVASAYIIGAKVSKRLLAIYKPEKIIYIGCIVMTGGAIFLSVITSFGSNPNIIYMIGFLVAMFILLLGIGIALPNCLSLALVDFQDVIGTAGALFSLGYYIIVTMTIWGMSQLSIQVHYGHAALFFSYCSNYGGFSLEYLF